MQSTCVLVSAINQVTHNADRVSDLAGVSRVPWPNSIRGVSQHMLTTIHLKLVAHAYVQ